MERHDQPLRPETAPAAATPAADPATEVFSPRLMEALRKTRVWVLFLAVIGLLGTLAVAGMILFAMLGEIANSGAVVAPIVLLLVVGIIYFLPVLLLYQYAEKIGAYLRGGRADELTDLLAAQRRLWTLAGVYCVLVLLFLTFSLFLGFAGSV